MKTTADTADFGNHASRARMIYSNLMFSNEQIFRRGPLNPDLVALIRNITGVVSTLIR